MKLDDCFWNLVVVKIKPESKEDYLKLKDINTKKNALRMAYEKFFWAAFV